MRLKTFSDSLVRLTLSKSAKISQSWTTICEGEMRKLILIGACTLMNLTLLLSQQNIVTDAVPLNHFYLVTDSETYRAIEESPFLRKEFSVNEKRTTTRTDISYTGVYFYGVNTYFEFFDAGSTTMGKLHDSGIALGVDRLGALETIRTRLASEFVVGEPITRGLEGKQIPWFYMGVPRNFSMGSGLRFWLMEYHPRFLNEWNARSNEKGQGISRKEILKRYADVLKDSQEKRYLKDVIGLTIALEDPTRFIELCRLLGYRQQIKGTTTILKGENITFTIIPQTTAARGIKEILMQVNGEPAQREFHFGARSILRFQDGGLAKWSF
jgi:hypothetical protein